MALLTAEGAAALRAASCVSSEEDFDAAEGRVCGVKDSGEGERLP